MKTRYVRPEDNDELIALSKMVPMEGDIKVCMDRSPDFFSFYNQYGPDQSTVDPSDIDRMSEPGWVAICAEDEGKIVGYFVFGAKLLRYEGEIVRAVFPSDARVHPDYQHKGVIKQLGADLIKDWGIVPGDVILGYIIRGNVRAEKGFQEGVKLVKGIPAGEFSMIQASMYRPYRNAKIAIERATEEDIPEIIDLLAEFYADYHFSPIFDRENWDRMMSVAIGYDVNDIRIVRENNKIQALVGLWDQRQIRRVVATEFRGAIKWGIRLAKMIHTFMQSPPPPVAGQPQYSMYIKHIAHRPGKLDLLVAMMKNVINEVRIGAQHNYIWGAFYQSDPLLAIWDQVNITVVRSGQYYVPWNTGWSKTPHEIESKPCFADFSTV